MKYITGSKSQWLRPQIILCFVLVAVIFVFAHPNNSNSQVLSSSTSKGDYMDIPSIGASDEYVEESKTFKTFSNDVFSFYYPSHLELIQDTDGSGRIYLIPKDSDKDTLRAIIISIGNNDEKQTPEQWLLGDTSGFDKKEEYHKTKINGVDAVSTGGGMWYVLNSRDNSKRISIADLPYGQSGLYAEMGAVIEEFHVH